MNSGFYPKVENPTLTNNIPQMKSGASQTPFFFGGSQTPIDLGLPAGSFSGSGMCGSGMMKTAQTPSVNKGKTKVPVMLPFKR